MQNTEAFRLSTDSLTVGLDVTNGASQSANLPGGSYRQVMVYNAGANDAAVTYSITGTPATAVFPTSGTGAVVARHHIIPAGTQYSFTVDPNIVSMSAICASGTTTLYITRGWGL
jgi:hypothetical protein